MVIYRFMDHKFNIQITLLLSLLRSGSVFGTATRCGLHEAVIKSR